MILLLNIPRSNLERGQKLLVTFNLFTDFGKINRVVFYEYGHVYAYAKMHGISVENPNIIKIFTNTELGVDKYGRKALEELTTDALFINWDYPTCFKRPIEANMVSIAQVAPVAIAKEIQEAIDEMEEEA